MSGSLARAGIVTAVLAQSSPDFSSSPEGRTPVAPGPADWFLLGLSVLAVIVVIALCVRFFVRPGESSEEHIKRRILRDEVEREGGR